MKPKKSLGQNFFVNKNLGDFIIKNLENSNIDSVVEIGPGMGFFTERLIRIFNNVTVVEKDTVLANNLKIQYPNINVINKDILELNLNEFGDTILFGSLPYNISKPIIQKIVEYSSFKNPTYFIIQKEVAEKYIYKKPYSLLSLTTSIYSDCKKILDISPDSFRPKPNVNSTFISFIPTKRIVQRKEDLKKLLSLSFRQPRKNMFNNLRDTVYEKGVIKYKTYRPAQLSLDEYIDILNHSV